MPDHAHIVLTIGRRKEGIALYNGRTIGDLAVRHAMKALRMSPEERFELKERLDEIS